MIQRNRRADSIVLNFNFTAFARRLLQHNRPFCDITRRARDVRFGGVKRTCHKHRLRSASDPKPTYRKLVAMSKH